MPNPHAMVGRCREQVDGAEVENIDGSNVLWSGGVSIPTKIQTGTGACICIYMRSNSDNGIKKSMASGDFIFHV